MSAGAVPRILLIAPFQQLRDQGRPAGLVAGAQARPRRRRGSTRGTGCGRASAGRSGRAALPPKTGRRPPRDSSRRKIRVSRRDRSLGDLVQVDLPARAGGQLDLEVVAEVAMVLAQRLDDQEVDREPDRPPPVRVAAVDRAGRLGRLVGDQAAVALERAMPRAPWRASECRSRRGTGRGRAAGPGLPSSLARSAIVISRWPSAPGCGQQAGVARQVRPVPEVPVDPAAEPREPIPGLRRDRQDREQRDQAHERADPQGLRAPRPAGGSRRSRTGPPGPTSRPVPPIPLIACAMATKCSKNLVAIAS